MEDDMVAVDADVIAAAAADDDDDT